MNDLISRQSAIDMLATMQGRCTSKTALIQNSKIWQQIKDLPSAQPERCEDCVNFSKTRLLIPQPEIIRCKDCKYAEVADSEDSQDGYICQFHRGSIWFSGSYCSWGERKSE